MKTITETNIKEFREYLLSEEKAQATVLQYVRSVTDFSAWLADKHLEKMVVLDYKTYLCEKYSPASVTVTGTKENVGILSGFANGHVSNINVSGSVVAEDSSYVAGIIGNYTRSHSYEIGELTNKADILGADYVGGIFGRVQNSTDSGSHYTVTFVKLENTGNIVGTGDYVGGLIGYGYFYNDCYYSGGRYYSTAIYMSESKNMGAVKGKTYVGGLIGYVYSDNSSSTIMDSSTSGNVIGTSEYGDWIGKAENVKVY